MLRLIHHPYWNHLAESSTLSLKGKKASEAIAAPLTLSPDFLMEISVESIRLICPAPTPTTISFLTNTILLDFTCLQTIKAKCKSAISFSEGFFFVTTLRFAESYTDKSLPCKSMPPTTRFISKAHGSIDFADKVPVFNSLKPL